MSNAADQLYLGRQPILDRDQRLYAYELLFRNGSTNAAEVTDGVQATATVIANALAELGVEALPAEALRLGMAWRHLPIPDRQPPGPAFEARWPEVGAELVMALREGRRIFLHCKGGLGRTGTIAARLLREAGIGAAEAITQVRLARPKTIETAQQARYVHAYTRRFGGNP